jgi:hypothetical protein
MTQSLAILSRFGSAFYGLGAGPMRASDGLRDRGGSAMFARFDSNSVRNSVTVTQSKEATIQHLGILDGF